MATVYERFQHLGLAYNNEILSKAGYHVARHWDQSDEVGRRLKPQKEGEEIYDVWNYPEEWVPKLDRLILEFVANGKEVH